MGTVAGLVTTFLQTCASIKSSRGVYLPFAVKGWAMGAMFFGSGMSATLGRGVRRPRMLSPEMQITPGFGPRRQEICHDMRQPVASLLPLAPAALAETPLPTSPCARIE